jgi:hypothetical protein
LSTHSNFGLDRTLMGTLHEDAYAFLCTEVVEWGISRQPWLLWFQGNLQPAAQPHGEILNYIT